MNRTDYLADALDFLSSITDAAWDCIIGHQGREEFALLAFNAGESIEHAWITAVQHANTL